MYIVAFDPGGTTGWAAVDWYRDRPIEEHTFTGGHLGPGKHLLELWGFLESYMPDIVVCEHYVPQTRGDAPAAAMDLIARNYEGVIELWCLQRGRPIHFQNASEGKGLFTVDKITRLGLWKKVKHTRDATSHLLHYITNDRSDFRWLKKATTRG